MWKCYFPPTSELIYMELVGSTFLPTSSPERGKEKSCRPHLKAIPFWLQFHEDGTLQGGGINHLWGNYSVLDDHINIRIDNMTEIYDPSGWEDRLLAALNDATICDILDYGGRMRIYYDQNRKFLEFTLE